MKKKKLIKILYCIYLLLYICFIFSNSIKSREVSANESNYILNALNNFFESVNIPIVLSGFFIRKLAHFTEFFILGLSFSGYIILDKKIKFNNCIQIGFLSCLVAMTDETIQYFSGRGSMLLDVWLDFTSAVVAIFVMYLFFMRKHKIDK